MAQLWRGPNDLAPWGPDAAGNVQRSRSLMSACFADFSSASRWLLPCGCWSSASSMPSVEGLRPASWPHSSPTSLFCSGACLAIRVSQGAAWLWFALGWFISPIDLIPEFLPVVGPLDDAIVAALVLRHVLRRTDRSVLADHWRGDPFTLDAIIRIGGRQADPPRL